MVGLIICQSTSDQFSKCIIDSICNFVTHLVFVRCSLLFGQIQPILHFRISGFGLRPNLWFADLEDGTRA
jgi:hypothetical protein